MRAWVKEFWQVIAILFIFTGSWATVNYKIRELEKRIEKLEKPIETIKENK